MFIDDLKVSDSSKKNYRSTFNGLLKLLGVQESELLNYLKDSKKAIKTIREATPSAHTLRNRGNICVLFLRHEKAPTDIINRYELLTKEQGNIVDNNYISNEPSQKEKDNFINVNDLKDILNKMKDDLPDEPSTAKDIEKIYKYVLLKFHLSYPLRNDLIHAKIYSDPSEKDLKEDANIIDLKNKKLYLKIYKTAKIYGDKVIDLDNDTYEIIKDFPLISNPDNYLFIDPKTGEPYERTKYIRLFENALKGYSDKRLSSTLIRHIVVSDLYKPKPDELKKKMELANIMGHSTGVAAKMYSKVI